MSSTPLQDQKDVEFYAAAVTAWLNTTLEYDKSLLALSAGGIGLLITLLTTTGLGNLALVVLYISAIFAFLICLVTVLAVFRRNRTHIQNVVSGKKEDDAFLSVLDAVAMGSFGIGAVLAAVIGVSTAVVSYSQKEKLMSNENRQPPTDQAFNKSFNGLGGLQSQPTASVPAEQPAPAPAPAPTNSSTSNSGSGSSSGSLNK